MSCRPSCGNCGPEVMDGWPYDNLPQLGAKEKQLVIVPGATHLFEERGALAEVARLAAD